MKELLYVIPPEEHGSETLRRLFKEHDEVKFVSFMGIDLGGNATDEKIPIHVFIKDMEDFLQFGIQTDGSSVVLHEIATLNNARLDIIPDLEVNWMVDYNHDLLDEESNLPVGTLVIPSFLVHENKRVGSRAILDRAFKYFKQSTMDLLKNHPHLLENMGIKSIDKIADIELTSATELEFWVKSPEDLANVEKLSTSQTLKEQYWKRTQGTVRTALEKTLMEMDKYGLKTEMGHKEVGGVRSKIGVDGRSNHVMEQLEIDWKYTINALQTADNELFIRRLIVDMFHRYGLEVTFRAKPTEGVAGSGEHTHLGVVAKLKNGKYKNLFAPMEAEEDYLSVLGYGALMGILRNYEIVNPFITASIDAFNRLKPGFEAPVCIVTSLGHTPEEPSRNRSVLVGLVRDIPKPIATRFEVRSPNPFSNTYLVISSIYQAMLDGMLAAAKSGKNNKELEREISKEDGEEGFYLERNRAYRSELNVFEHFTKEERDAKFGIHPATPWENVNNLAKYKDRLEILLNGGVMTQDIIDSVIASTIDRWTNELEGRVLYDNMELIRECKKLHGEDTANDLDEAHWKYINHLRQELMKSSNGNLSILGSIREALHRGDYQRASDLQITMNEKVDELRNKYIEYKQNLFES
jgi:glutamine synthetase